MFFHLFIFILHICVHVSMCMCNICAWVNHKLIIIISRLKILASFDMSLASLGQHLFHFDFVVTLLFRAGGDKR